MVLFGIRSMLERNLTYPATSTMALTITKDTYPELSLDPREIDKFNASDPDTQQMYLTQWRVSAVLVVF